MSLVDRVKRFLEGNHPLARDAGGRPADLELQAATAVVLLEAAISFLEMGTPSQVASWGETLAEGARNPHRIRLIIAPGLALLTTIAGSYLLADALRDAMDPHTVRKRPSDQGDDSPLSVMWRDSSRP